MQRVLERVLVRQTGSWENSDRRTGGVDANGECVAERRPMANSRKPNNGVLGCACSAEGRLYRLQHRMQGWVGGLVEMMRGSSSSSTVVVVVVNQQDNVVLIM